MFRMFRSCGGIGGEAPGDDLAIPAFLEVANRKVPFDRRPALGPEGDSLDDLQ